MSDERRWIDGKCPYCGAEIPVNGQHLCEGTLERARRVNKARRREAAEIAREEILELSHSASWRRFVLAMREHEVLQVHRVLLAVRDDAIEAACGLAQVAVRSILWRERPSEIALSICTCGHSRVDHAHFGGQCMIGAGDDACTCLAFEQDKARVHEP